MLLSIGVDFPKANTFVSFDNNVAYTMANVNYPEEKDNTEIMEDNAMEEVYKVFNAGEQSQDAEDFQKETGDAGHDNSDIKKKYA